MDDFDFEPQIENQETSWQWGGKDASIFLIDCSSKMHIIPEGDVDEISFFNKSLKCAESTMKRKIIGNDQDLSGVVIYNSKTTKNALDFANIEVFQELERPGAGNILELEKLILDDDSSIKASNNIASIHDVLWVCRNLFIGSKSKFATKNIFMFTCDDNPHVGDDHKLQQAFKGAKDLRECGIEFEILPMGFDFNMNNFYKDLLTEGLGDEEPRSLSTLTNPTSRFEELMERVRRYEHKQRSMAKVPFIIAPGVECGVKIFTSIRKATKPTKVHCYTMTNEPITTQKKEMLETGEILMPSDFVKYQTYGGKKIKFTMDEIQAVNHVHDAGIEILGFQPRSKFKPFLFIKPASFIYPDEDSYKGSRKMFACLLERCLAKSVCPIVRIQTRQGSNVCWGFLLPQKEELDDNGCQIKSPGFNICYLPFADDFRSIAMENRPRAEFGHIDAAKAIMKKIQFEYDPNSFENPNLQTHWRNVETLALNKAHLEPIDDYTVPNHDMIRKKAGRLIETLKSLVLPDSYDPEAVLAKRKPPAPRPPASKKPKLDVGSLQIEDLAQKKMVHKLTVNVLQNWLREKGCQKVSTKKKAELVQDVYDVLEIDVE